MVWTSFPSLASAPSRRAAWDPWREMGRLHDEVSRLFGEVRRPTQRAGFPPARIETSDEGARLIALVPGVPADALDVSVEGDLVKLEARRPAPEAAEGESALRRERPFGEFQRSFRLPFEVDAEHVVARLENGVLELTLPRTPEQRPRKIEVRSS